MLGLDGDLDGCPGVSEIIVLTPAVTVGYSQKLGSDVSIDPSFDVGYSFAFYRNFNTSLFSGISEVSASGVSLSPNLAVAWYPRRNFGLDFQASYKVIFNDLIPANPGLTGGGDTRYLNLRVGFYYAF